MTKKNYTEFVVRVYHLKDDADCPDSYNSAKHFQDWINYHTEGRKITVKKVKEQS